MLATKTRFATLLGLTALFAIYMVSSGLAGEQRFTTIDVPDASFTVASGVNAKGDIVGFYNEFSHGFLLSKGAFTTIDVPGAVYTVAFGINAKGDIVGDYANATGLHGFLLSKGAFTTIDVPGALDTGVSGIN